MGIRRFYCLKRVTKAELKISVVGIFRNEINGSGIDKYIPITINMFCFACMITRDMQGENSILLYFEQNFAGVINLR